jgi:hypothetical protein
MTQRVRLARIKTGLDATIGFVEKRAEFLWDLI